MRGMFNLDQGFFDYDNVFSFPSIRRVTDRVECAVWTDFDVAVGNKVSSGGLHFFIDDYKFDRIWKNPHRYIDILRRFDYVIMPDFSLYYDFPVALQIYNKYRNHWLACYFSANGINVIPNIRLSTYDNYYWTIMGYPDHSVVAFSDSGCTRENMIRHTMDRAFSEMVDKLEPLQILYFTRQIDSAPAGVSVIEIPYFRR